MVDQPRLEATRWTDLRRSRRAVLSGAATLAIGSVLAACSPAPAPQATTAPASSAPAAKPAATTAPAAKPAATPAAASAPASKPAKQISFATDWNSGVRKETVDATLKEFLDRNPEIKIEAHHVGSGVGSFAAGGLSENIVAQFIGGNAPDLVFGWNEMVVAYHNYLTDLTPMLNSTNYRELGIMELPYQTHVGGKQYGINFAPATGGWSYNITMFEQAGVDLPTNEWTWDDVVQASIKITNPDEKRWGFWARNDPAYGYLPLVIANGGSYFTDDTMKKVNLNDANGRQAFEWWVDLLHKHKVSPTPGTAAGLVSAETNDLFLLGMVAMAPAGLQSVGNHAKSIGDRFKWGIMHYAKAPQTNDREWFIRAEGLSVPLDSQKRGNAEEALKLALFLSGDDFAQNFIAVNRPTVPVKASAFNSPLYQKPPPEGMSVIATQMSDSSRQDYSRPMVKWWGEFIQKITAQVDLAIIGEAPAAQAWEAATKAAQSVVDSV